MAQLDDGAREERGVPAYEGRLELTWTNKPLRLLAHEDGSYEWVPPSDYRVAEVRLLHEAGTVGLVHGTCDRAKDNLLIRGDALNALTSLIELPEFEREYAGKVKLAYLDPPFNTQQSFLHYDDALEHSVWLTMMRDRLLGVKTLLAPEGSVYVHCDASEGHYLKVLMDEIFGRENFRNEIVWKRTNARKTEQQWPRLHDTLLFYSKSADLDFRPLSVPAEQAKMPHTLITGADGNKYQTFELTAPGRTQQGESGRPWRFYDPSSMGRHWANSHSTMDAWDAAGLIHWPRNRGFPRRRAEEAFVESERMVAVGDVWVDMDRINQAAQERVGFATQKPEALLQRIVAASSDRGDIVLDCFLGSGTTAAVAQKMDRRWVGVEWSRESVEGYVVPRLTQVVEGADEAGISKDVRWTGGGGFRVLDVAPSMFETIDGQVFLSEWAMNDKLAEVTAAQLHYDYEYGPPFVGRRGRSRLCVIDGLINEDVVRLVVNALPEDERLVVCGTAIDPEAKSALRKLRPGSTVRKIPQSILQEYRQSARWVQPRLLDADANSSTHLEAEAAQV
jgi:adenine-specific DNA-methyltransferase